MSFCASTLAGEIAQCGFFPQMIADSVASTLANEPIDRYLLHYQATFARENIGRHLSVLVLTPTRLIVTHTDEGADNSDHTALISTEAVPLTRLGAVVLTRAVSHPEGFGTSEAHVVETWMSLNWGSVKRIDVEPARCSDPSCEADHGYTGTSAREDIMIRMSLAADGEDNVARMIDFATVLQQRVGQR